MEDRIGQQLGNYRLLRLIGQGGFADVYLGEHIHLGTQAAIKVLQLRLGENNIEGFLNEAKTIAHLVHPYIIRVLDFGVQDNIPFLVMDYAPHGTFRQRFLHNKPLPPAPIVPYIKQAAAALHHGHEHKLIHRDVKPENMLLGPNDEVLLSDFGLAVIAHTSIKRSPTETAGTAAYMAPEQLQGKPCPNSDQYALGIIAYEWLSGSCPFQGSFYEIASQQVMAPLPPLRDKVPGIPYAIEKVIIRALEKDPQNRFSSVKDFALALEDACLSSQQYSFDLSMSRSFDSASAIFKDRYTYSSLGVPSSSSSLFTDNQLSLDASSQSAIFPLMEQSDVKSAYTSFAGKEPFSMPELQSFSSQSNMIMPEAFGSSSASAATLPPWPTMASNSFSSSFTDLPPLENLPETPQLPTAASLWKSQASAIAASPFLNAPIPQPSASSSSTPKKSYTRAWFIGIIILFILGSGAALSTIANRQTTGIPNMPTSHATQPAAGASNQQKSQVPTGAENKTLPDPYAQHSTLALNDPLSTNSHQWQVGSNYITDGSCQFKEGQGYQLYASTIQQQACQEQQTTYTNFAYEVTMKFSTIDQLYSGAGITFRSNGSEQYYYYFEVLGNGAYTIQICDAGDCTTTLDGYSLGKGALPMFKQGIGATNTLAVVAKGNAFAFFVNHQDISEIQDQASTYTSGYIGLMATGGNDEGIDTTAGSSPTTVLFTNAHVWKLP